MTQADPWDEAARLEKQMEAELLSRLEKTAPKSSSPRAGSDRNPADQVKPRPPEA